LPPFVVSQWQLPFLTCHSVAENLRLIPRLGTESIVCSLLLWSGAGLQLLEPDRGFQFMDAANTTENWGRSSLKIGEKWGRRHLANSDWWSSLQKRIQAEIDEPAIQNIAVMDLDPLYFVTFDRSPSAVGDSSSSLKSNLQFLRVNGKFLATNLGFPTDLSQLLMSSEAKGKIIEN